MPWLGERGDIVRMLHDNSRHFGIKRSASVVVTEYWWDGMYGQVRRYVRSCDTCARAKASFIPQDIQLHPLPFMGMIYRRYVELMGPFSQSQYGNFYIKVMIERFSK